MVSEKTGLPHVLKVYGGDLSVVGRNSLLRGILRRVLMSADQLVSNSNFTSLKAQEICKKEVIPVFEGTDPEIFKPSANLSMVKKIKEKYGEGPILFSLGRFVPYKGFEYAVKAMPRLKKIFPNIKLIIGGIGPLKESIQQLVQNLKLSDSVHLPGFIPNKLLPSFYAACDVYIAPSIIDEMGNTEGLNVTVLDAMSTGKPVVASRVGGMVEAVKNGETGILVPEKNPLKLSEAITKLLLDKKLASAMGRQGRRRILEFFTINRVAKRITEVCESAIRNKR
jgi:glycosyltransferase involved in cell wall biosynthesis